MKIEEFLDVHFALEDLKNFIEENITLLPLYGSKSEVIERITTFERFQPEMLHKWLSKDELQNICKEMGLDATGRKIILWERILDETNYFDDKYSELKPRVEIIDGITSLVFNPDALARKCQVNPEIKPLLAKLFKLGIVEYLKKNSFQYLVLALNLDELWKSCLEFAKKNLDLI